MMRARAALLLALLGAAQVGQGRRVVPADQGPHARPVAFADGGTYFIGTGGAIGALPPYGGWDSGLRLLIQPAAAAAVGDLLLVTDVFRDRVVAFRRDGTVSWRASLPGRAGALIPWGEGALAHLEDGHLATMAPNGALASRPTGLSPTSWQTRPVAAGPGQVLLTGADGEGQRLALWDVEAGEAIWSVPLAGAALGAPAVAGGSVVLKVEGADLGVDVRSLATGALEARVALGLGSDLRHAGVQSDGEAGYVPLGRRLLRLGPLGAQAWSWEAGGAVGEPAILGGVVAVGVRAGEGEAANGVAFLDAATGTLVSHHHLPAGVEAPVAVVGDTFVAVSLAGVAVVFTP